jgi:hypothetical protein
VGLGGEASGVVAEAVFDRAEELVLGQIDQVIGHPLGGGFEQSQELLAECQASGVAVKGERRRGRRNGVQHGWPPAVTAMRGSSFPHSAQVNPRSVLLHRNS